ncbi:MAG: hypothetical protein JXJ20_06075 [Anaerolineae bacterium]|nr:hypothetical protein [Anaerolineae bacterium]
MSSSANTARKRIKPTLDTKFHIDYDWWSREEQELRAYLLSHLATEQRELLAKHRDINEVDWVDPVTAEVHKVDALQRALQEASQKPDFITVRTSLVDAVFRIFLANNNTPLTPIELGERIGRPPMTILRTLSGANVYKGLRPAVDQPKEEE